MTAWRLPDNCLTSSYYWGRIMHKPWKRHRNTEMTKDRYRTAKGLRSKTFLIPWWAVSKLADRAWRCHQTRIRQDAYLCIMWYVKLVAPKSTKEVILLHKIAPTFQLPRKNFHMRFHRKQKIGFGFWKVINLDGLISSCSNMILTRFSHFQCKYRLWDYILILSLRYMQELTQIGMRGILLSPSPF